MTTTAIALPEPYLSEIRTAKTLLENPGLGIKIVSAIGTPIEKGIDALPAKWQQKIGEVTRAALLYALKAAVATMSSDKAEASPRWHMLAAAASGAGGGAFGLIALPIELPISTGIMCRSIADIAREQGEDINSLEVKLACLEVFAMGGLSQADNAAETGYFAVRAALAASITDALAALGRSTVIDESAPAILRLIAQIAGRMQVQVSEKALGQAVPMIGAIFGGVINTMFIDHFQDMAKGHFTIRKLERQFGSAAIRNAYETL